MKEIKVYVNSGGGCAYSGLAIADIIRFGFEGIKFSVHVIGLAASAATMILCSGHERIMTANSYIMIHQPLTTYTGGGKSTDINIMANSLNELRGKIARFYSQVGSKSYEYFLDAITQDFYMNFDGAKKLGLVDKMYGECMDHGMKHLYHDSYHHIDEKTTLQLDKKQ